MDPTLEQRWGFLAPWSAALVNRLEYYALEMEGAVWDDHKRSLCVMLPTRKEAFDDFVDMVNAEDFDGSFQNKFNRVREALALLTAVANVDYAAWKYLLVHHCKVNIGEKGEEEFEEEIPLRFVLLVDPQRYDEYRSNLGDDYAVNVVSFCSADQRVRPTPEYLEALKKIASLKNFEMDRLGVDIEVPVRVCVSVEYWQQAVKLLSGVHRAEEVVKREWEKCAAQAVTRGALRCTFVLERMVVQLRRCELTLELVDTLERLLRDNVWLSQLSLDIYTPSRRGQFMVQDFGRLMSSLFDSSNRCSELACTRYHIGFDRAGRESSEHQLGTITLTCRYALSRRYLEMMCSAMVLNQMSTRLLLKLDIFYDNLAQNRRWWKWLAYALFSKRARMYSSVEYLALDYIGSMSVADMQGFSEVLASAHPEEELFRCRRGRFNERDATLKAGAPIKWDIDRRGHPTANSSLMAFDFPTLFVRTFGDDGESDWVNVLIPGYGRCHVRRCDLVFHDPGAGRASNGKLMNLRIGFEYDIDSSGLPVFLSAVGSSLKALKIFRPPATLTHELILRACSNLEELSLCDDEIDIKIDLKERRANTHPPHPLPFQTHDIPLLVTALSDPNSALTKSARRLRVKKQPGWLDDRSSSVEHDLTALLEMLEVNRSLEYLEVVISPSDPPFVDDFMRHHLQPIARAHSPLPRDSKAAFLSVLTPQDTLPEGNKRSKHESLRPQVQLDTHVVSTIFAFAAPPVLRKVYFRRLDLREETCIGIWGGAII